ncbi:Leishmanolysin-like peptidase isoform 2 [Schistosoma japonicum]|uniref:Leishmanolysin-like peptidase n=1 Tax=Schistosoma japonicum TaxID=6182 RepID=A0A4Z2DNZ8_SCHJA|nr:Leishmanolysin-like peptidase isoform 2 [Schistosoma japonicum]
MLSNQCIIWFLLLTTYNYVNSASFCGSPPLETLNHTFAVHSVNTEKRNVKPQRLKFYPHYTNNFHVLQDSRKLMEFAKQAMLFWEETLTVKNPGSEKQLSKRYCDNNYYYIAPNNTIFCRGSRCKQRVMCGSVQIPDEYVSECFEEYYNRLYRSYNNGSGIPFAGYVLLIDALSTSTCSGSTAAYASSCLMNPNTDRPILGYVNVCPGKMKVVYPENRNSLGIFIHEIGHALGFSASAFAFMRDANGKPRTPRDSKGKPTHIDRFGTYIPSQTTIKKITRPWRSVEGRFTKDFHAFVTPKILGEIMAGRIEVDYAVSRVTLSFFDDSGWYIVNYKKAMEWEYGRKAGCTFVTRSCFEYAETKRRESKNFVPFCDNLKYATCRDAFSYGTCSILRYTQPLPKEDRFFKTAPFDTQYSPAYFGGEDPFKDYCPTLVYVSGLGSDYKATSFCTHSENIIKSRQGVNRYFQTYGSDSICIQHRNVWTYTDRYIYTLSDYLRGSCHQYKCHGSTAMSLYFKSATVNCTKANHPVSFNVTDGGKTLKGEILCPNIKRFCKSK